MAPVEPLSINAIQLPHTKGEVSVRRFNHKMVMVVHQAIGVTEPMIPFTNALKGIEKGIAVPISPKDCLSLIAPAGDVVDRAGIFYAEGAGHD